MITNHKCLLMPMTENSTHIWSINTYQTGSALTKEKKMMLIFFNRKITALMLQETINIWNIRTS